MFVRRADAAPLLTDIGPLLPLEAPFLSHLLPEPPLHLVRRECHVSAALIANCVYESCLQLPGPLDISVGTVRHYTANGDMLIGFLRATKRAVTPYAVVQVPQELALVFIQRLQCHEAQWTHTLKNSRARLRFVRNIVFIERLLYISSHIAMRRTQFLLSPALHTL